MRRLSSIALAVTAALALLLTVLGILNADRLLSGRAGDDEARAYLPFALASPPTSPVGSYNCYEYEFGMVWYSEVITLNTDGSSVYDYDPPYLTTMTGTWGYTPSMREVQFTNFRWPTATYEAPHRLWASRYLPEPDFEVALGCTRR